MAKEFLSQKGIVFTDRDVTRDPAAMDELRPLGFMTTPVITVDGETIVGFDEARLTQALRL
ncbi:MAG: glutaredoxin family protein [Terriglobales bacterium]